MFGRNYNNHLDVLKHSFDEMNEEHRKELTNPPNLTKALQRSYISVLGIPEIGFQLRSLVFRKLISQIPPEMLAYILDAGSGIGAYTFFLAEKYPHATVTGGDIDKKKLIWCKHLRKEFSLHNTNFIFFDVTKTKTRKKYNLIVTIDVLEHVPDYRAALKNFSRHLVKGGYLYIHVPQPNQKRLFSFMKTWEHADHVREGIGYKTLKKDLKLLGFSVIASRETFGFFGKLAWELNHMTLAKNFMLAGLLYPILLPLVWLDTMVENKRGLGIAVLAVKI